jgi:hypothetical protein
MPCAPDQVKQYWDADRTLGFTRKLTVQGIGQRGAAPRASTNEDGRQVVTKENPEFRRVEIHFIPKSDLEINESFKMELGADQTQLTPGIEACNRKYPVRERDAEKTRPKQD